VQWSTTFSSAAVRAFVPGRRQVLEPQAATLTSPMGAEAHGVHGVAAAVVSSKDPIEILTEF
jgi:hypothetical protein